MGCFFCLAKEIISWETMQQCGMFSIWLQQSVFWGGTVMSHLGLYSGFNRDHEAEGQSEILLTPCYGDK